MAFADLAALLAFLGQEVVDEDAPAARANASSLQDSCSSLDETGETL
jgi:hypothetical protein